MLSKIFVSVCAFALLTCGLPCTAHAQLPTDNRTLLTFSGPVTLPGMTLQGGTYLFRLGDSIRDRRIVQVLSEDGKRTHAMLLAIPAQRMEPPDNPEVRFLQTPYGMPVAIRSWWFPGTTIGWELVYPQDQASKLAALAAQGVLTTSQAQATTTEQMKTADLSRMTSSGELSAVTVQAKPAVAPIGGGRQQGEVASSTLVIPSAPALARQRSGGSPASTGTSGSRPSSGTQKPASR